MEAVMKKRRQKSAPVLADNSIAKKAIDAIAQIEKEAQAKKLAHVEELRSAKAAIHERINELNHQLKQIDSAITSITGTPVGLQETTKRRERRDLVGDRDRVGRWLESHKGEKFGAGDLVKEFPELDGVQMSMFLKPLVEAGKLKTDVSEGIRRTKYFVAESAG